jgi:hypothetical protein
MRIDEIDCQKPRLPRGLERRPFGAQPARDRCGGGVVVGISAEAAIADVADAKSRFSPVVLRAQTREAVSSA